MTDRPRDAFLMGERCYLRPLREADIAGNWLHWFNDPEVTRYMLRGVFPATAESHAEFYRQVAGSESDLVLAIVAREGDVHVGNIGLHRIDWQNRYAEYGVVIGERDFWGQGIGTEATRLICRHGFDRLNLHRIWLGVFADHAVAIRMYERIGFRVEGTMREEILRDGRYLDKVIMGLLAGDLRDGEA
jgi:RimJ/RimL family protein N-acetyltransferase